MRSDERRLVTLTGPGGVGKTRLSREVARRLADQVQDGVWWVPLATATEAGDIVTAIASTLGLREAGDRPLIDVVAAWLADRDATLVLDNLEQIDGAATPIGKLLAGCSRLHILATSRAPLRAAAEREVAVAPFLVPATSAAAWTEASATELDAVRLFVERAQAVRADFTLSDDNATAVVTICRRLDGLPLAIELAAARGRVLSPAALLARLDPALPLLIGGASDQPERLQTMRGAIAWSVGLLPDAAREVFARLAVFVGGADLAAAEAIGAGNEPTPRRLAVRSSTLPIWWNRVSSASSSTLTNRAWRCWRRSASTRSSCCAIAVRSRRCARCMRAGFLTAPSRRRHVSAVPRSGTRSI